MKPPFSLYTGEPKFLPTFGKKTIINTLPNSGVAAAAESPLQLILPTMLRAEARSIPICIYEKKKLTLRCNQ